MVKNGLLALLERGPMYGYQLRSEFEASTGATWTENRRLLEIVATVLENGKTRRSGPPRVRSQGFSGA